MIKTAYLVQPAINDQPQLCIIDDERGFFTFDIGIDTLSRLNMESAVVINVALGGFDFKRAHQEIAEHVSKLWTERRIK